MLEAFIGAGRRALGYPDADQCGQCGTAWVRAPAVCRGVIAGVPGRFGALLAEGEDQPRDPGVWSPTAYTVHVGDWLRIWTERLVAAADRPDHPSPSIDQDELAAVRGYEHVGRAAALHVLAAGAREALEVLDRIGLVEFESPDFGTTDSETILSWLAHEVDHHAWDIARLRGLAG